MLTAITPTQRVTVFADAYKEPIVSGKLAKDVSWQDVGRYAECLVRAFEACEDGSIAIGIVFGGVR